MARDGLLVPVESTQTAAQSSAAKKKTAALRSWISLDQDGEGTVLDLDKYAIIRRVQIHARDLRLLDPLLSYPSTILGREKVIVLNLEVGSHFHMHFRFDFGSDFYFDLFFH